jgi:hypothetical protein
VRLRVVAEEYYYSPIDLSVTEENLWRVLCESLVGDPDYKGEVKDRVDRLALLLVKFLHSRIDAENKRYTYLAPFATRLLAPKESALQLDLYNYLLGVGYADIERTDVSAGRADIYIPQNRFRFVIEVKRLFDDWEAELQPFMGQTTAYQQTDIRLGVLAVLDLTARPAGTPHISQCFEVRTRDFGQGDLRRAIVMRVPGNRVVPSSQK